MKKNRTRKGKSKSIVFLVSNNNINLILFVLLRILGTITIFNSIDGNIIRGVLGKNIANTQLVDSTASQHIVELEVSERNNNFVWMSANGQVNPEINLKSGTDYTIQIDSMNNNISYQLVIQDENGKQLAKSVEISMVKQMILFWHLAILENINIIVSTIQKKCMEGNYFGILDHESLLI